MSTELTQESPKLMDRLGTIAVGNRGIQLTNIDDVFRFAKAVHGSQLCPPGFSERDCFLVIANGLEVGMSPMAALANTYIVNNRAQIFGDMPLALVRQSGLLESYKQEYVGEEYKDNFKCVVTTKRRGAPDPITTEYSVADARLAEVWGKKTKSGQGTPWTNAPKRMLLFRARGFNLRDNFPDVLKGCAIAELDDGVGFENAREAVGRIVEPNFDQAQPPRLNSPPPTQQNAEMPKRRGRPPKAEKGEEALFGPSADMAPAPSEESLKEQVLARLSSENIPLADFLHVMEVCAFLSAAPEDIDSGSIGIESVSPEGLSRALEAWGDVKKMLPITK